MHRPYLTVLLVIAGICQAVNGSIEYIGEVRIANLWGSWWEMGYAHGYLLGPDMMDMYEEYFLELASGQGNVEQLRALYPLYFQVPGEFRQYAAGIIAGAADTISIWSDVYGRELDTLDIYITSSVPDLSAMVDFRMLMCSSASGWGAATDADPVLQGAPAVARNLDYYVDTGESILGMSVMFVLDPDQGQDWISIAFPGFMGCLSGMNEAGLNATLNMGNHQGTSQTSPEFVPICMALALGLAEEDFNGDGSCDIGDLGSAAAFWNRSNSYDIHITAPQDLSAGGDPAMVAEVNNHMGAAMRFSGDEPSIAPCRLLLTNHHRVLYPPVSCARYQRLLDSLLVSPDLTLNRLWDFMGSVGETPVPGLGGTLQTMILLPESRSIGLGLAASGMAPYTEPPVWIDWEDIFPNHQPQGVQVHPEGESVLQALENPVSRSILVSAQVSFPGELMLFDLSGRRVPVTFMEVDRHLFAADVEFLEPSVYFVTAGEECRQILVIPR